MLKVAINGMGVIGRELFRQLWDKEGFDIVLLNDFVPTTNLAYLLKYDSVYHGWKEMAKRISATADCIVVDGKSIRLYNESDPNDLPMGELGVDVVFECSGLLSSRSKLEGFINAGARRVISCDYCGNDLLTIVYNVNHQTLSAEENIIACPPMELQVTAAVLKAIKSLNVQSAIVKAYRSFTNAQYTLDSYYSDEFARGRAASVNISPVRDSFAKSVGLVIPELNRKVIGLAYRSPVANGSIMDFTIQLAGYHTVYEINTALEAACSDSLGYNEDEICSADAMTFDAPQIVSQLTKTVVTGDSTLVSISVVYDNIRGHCKALEKVAKYFGELG